MKNKKVFVSGSFDMLHSGHVAFLEEAASHGDLYVGIGSDRTIEGLKGRKTVYPEMERLYMIKALKVVKDAWINQGSGLLDFEREILLLRPDILFVNEDGDALLKQSFCNNHGIKYIVSKRQPKSGLPSRSTTALRKDCLIPYRIDLAGGWLDQPFVSKLYPGPVITISIHPDYEFNDRSGMATSTRRKAIELWQTTLPEGDLMASAKLLFAWENLPGNDYISGSQDALGIVLPGAARLWYREGQYWPEEIDQIMDDQKLDWLEERLMLLPLQPRSGSLKVLEHTKINKDNAQELSKASQHLWDALLQKDAITFGKAMTASFQAQTAMFPLMVNDEIKQAIQQLPGNVLGYKVSGAGGGGYLVLFAEERIPGTLGIRIRRN